MRLVPKKKLRLARQTVRQLSPAELVIVNGGLTYRCNVSDTHCNGCSFDTGC